MGEVWRPTSAAELAAMIANGQGLALRGAGTLAPLEPWDAPGVTVDMTGFAALESYEPGELVLRAGAGARLTDIEALLAEHGQMLAFEPPDLGPAMGRAAGASTLGGMIGAGLSGPRRISAGAVRDHLLGFEAVSGRGVTFKAGGPVVKNVTGYDLPKLLTGSWGALAAMTSVTLKVLPRPRATLTLAVSGLDAKAACEAMSQALGGPWAVSGAAWLPAATAGRATAPFDRSVTLLRIEGFSPSVQARAAGLRQALDGRADVLDEAASLALWRWIRNLGPFGGRGRRLWRLSGPPADGWRVVEALQSLEGDVLMDWAGGQVWWSDPDFDEPLLEARTLAAAARAAGGHALLLRGDGRAHELAGDYGGTSQALRGLSGRLKTAFDPKRVLASQRDWMFA